jgi:hypothetical protein
VVAVEVTFAGGAADHQRAEDEEARENLAQPSCHAGEDLARAAQQILVEQEKWLDRFDVALAIFEHEVAVFESLADGVFDDGVVAMILAMIDEAGGPSGAALDLFARNHVDDAIRRGEFRRRIFHSAPGFAFPRRRRSTAHYWRVSRRNLANAVSGK